MSRPRPKILLEITNKKTYKSEQVLEADAIWAVFYQDKPINLKTSSLIGQQLGPKYKKVSFSNAGHAFNLSEKLNKLFGTDEFSVFKLTTGEAIYLKVELSEKVNGTNYKKTYGMLELATSKVFPISLSAVEVIDIQINVQAPKPSIY